MAQAWSAKLRRRKGGEFRGHPVGTVAFYGPNDERATKVVASVVEAEGEPKVLRKWSSDEMDVRIDPKIGQAVEAFLRSFSVKSAVITRGIIGCPHEEGIDYPEGEACPDCPYWKDRDRWENV